MLGLLSKPLTLDTISGYFLEEAEKRFSWEL
jgi:hypothetical protein